MKLIIVPIIIGCALGLIVEGLQHPLGIDIAWTVFFGVVGLGWGYPLWRIVVAGERLAIIKAAINSSEVILECVVQLLLAIAGGLWAALLIYAAAISWGSDKVPDVMIWVPLYILVLVGCVIPLCRWFFWWLKDCIPRVLTILGDLKNKVITTLAMTGATFKEQQKYKAVVRARELLSAGIITQDEFDRRIAAIKKQ